MRKIRCRILNILNFIIRDLSVYLKSYIFVKTQIYRDVYMFLSIATLKEICQFANTSRKAGGDGAMGAGRKLLIGQGGDGEKMRKFANLPICQYANATLKANGWLSVWRFSVAIFIAAIKNPGSQHFISIKLTTLTLISFNPGGM